MRQVPLMATLAPTCMPSSLPGGKRILSEEKSPLLLTVSTCPWPWTMPACRYMHVGTSPKQTFYIPLAQTAGKRTSEQSLSALPPQTPVPLSKDRDAHAVLLHRGQQLQAGVAAGMRCSAGPTPAQRPAVGHKPSSLVLSVAHHKRLCKCFTLYREHAAGEADALTNTCVEQAVLHRNKVLATHTTT